MKLYAYIALSMYLLATCGLVVNLHFCCGGLAEIAVFGDLDPCSCDHSDHDCGNGDSCCDFESIYLSVGEEHNTPVQTVIIQELLGPSVMIQLPEVIALSDLEITNWAPIRDGPIPHSQPVYLANCSLVYYG